MTVMRLNVARKVRHYRLSKSRAYVALFEAISNSIDAIRERQTPGSIYVTFKRDTSQANLLPDIEDSGLLKEVTVTDDGIGFNDENYSSFLESDTARKEQLGGRGLGRFSWLKVFEKVEVMSHFVTDGKGQKRTFTFERTPDGISTPSLTDIADHKFSTTVKFVNQKKDWEIPKRQTTFAEKLIEHFLPLFVSGTVPKIVLVDDDKGDTLIVTNYFNDHYKGQISEKPFSVLNKDFLLSVHKTTIGSCNSLVLLANNRATKVVNLAKYIVDLENMLFDQDEEFFIIAFIKGDYLDSGASPERDEFHFGQDDEQDEIDVKAIIAEASAVIKKEISVLLQPIVDKKKGRLDNMVSTVAPEYRHVIAKNPAIVDEISPNASNAEIESILHREEYKQKQSTIKAIEKILEADSMEHEKVEKAFQEITETAKAELAKYVLWRKHIINLLEKRISWNTDKKFEKEDSLHNLFYSMRKTSDEVPHETNNLWLVDERLNFHSYLASDKYLDEESRPDVLIYNSPVLFNNSENPENSFVVIEFKRPSRNDYDDEENPIDQVYEYIDKIRTGKAKYPNGQLIIITENTPCYVYIISDLTEKMVKYCRKNDFIVTHDGLGFFYYHKEYRAYIEVISYQKVLKDSKQRNRIFMKKIGVQP
jgi:hypothetical protein